MFNIKTLTYAQLKICCYDIEHGYCEQTYVLFMNCIIITLFTAPGEEPIHSAPGEGCAKPVQPAQSSPEEGHGEWIWAHI